MRLLERLASLKGCLHKMAADAALFGLAYWLAFWVRLDGLEAPYDGTFWTTLPFFLTIKIAIFHYLGCYRSLWRYSSTRDVIGLAQATFFSFLALVSLAFLLRYELEFPRSVPFSDALLTMLFAGAVRFGVKVLHDAPEYESGRSVLRRPGRSKGRNGQRRALVVGAGDLGAIIVREMLRNPRMGYEPVAFVDDDPAKHRQSIHGVSVLGPRQRIPELVDSLKVKEVLIAIAAVRGETVQEIVKSCRASKVALKIVPDLSQIMAKGTVGLADVRDVRVEDLLGREPAELDLSLISGYLRGKRVLVTGAGGSIGSELCRQMVRFAPAEIQLLGRGEHSIYEIHRELADSAGHTRLVQIIGDVINKRKLEGVFEQYRPEIVFHAGADKHVPLMELNPDEAVLNNIVGTKHLLEVCNEYGVERVVVISTDKAVQPTSVMGCCKRVAELLVRSKLYGNTIALAVRFGNVLGSRGSVIPLFEKQIQAGGPLTLTHREIQRYFMTIPEAAGLVIQAGGMGRSRDIFVLDMGQPVKIWDLAHNLIRLKGLEPERDIAIKETGLRPGEKMHEELALDRESVERTSHPKILCVRDEQSDGVQLLSSIDEISQLALRMDPTGIRRVLKEIVPEYCPEDTVRDARVKVKG